MSQQLEVILTDRAGGQPMPSPQQSNAPSHAERTPGPADRQPVAGPQARREKSPDGSGGQPGEVAGPKARRGDDQRPVGAQFEKAAQIFGDALGVGGLTGTVLELRKAFLSLYQSVNKPAPRPDIGGNRIGETKRLREPGITKRLREPGVTGKPTEKSETVLAPSGPPAKEPVTGPPKLPPVTGPAAKDVAVDAEIVGPIAAESTLATLAAAAGPAAVGVAALTAAAVAGGIAIKKVAEGLNSEAHRLAKFSPQLAGANATNDIRLLFADLRRANQIGPQLARFQKRSGRIQEMIADIETQVLKVLLNIEELIGPLVEAVLSLTKVAVEYIPEIARMIVEFDKIAIPGFREMAFVLGAILKTIQKYLPKGKDPAGGNDPFMQAFLDFFEGRDPIAAAGRAAAGGMP